MSPEKSSTGEPSGKLVEVTGWDHHKTIFVFTLFILLTVFVKIVYHRMRVVANLVPESCVFILIGSAIDYLLSVTSTAVAELKPTFTIDIFFAVLLPPIMLESAYSLNQKFFYRSLEQILMYAVIGTALNIATIGPSLYAVELLDGRKWLNIPNVSFLELTIFGASLSAIDPVSVLALFRDLRVKRSLYYLVFGESLLNDAVVLVIHRILLDTLGSDKQAFSMRVLLLGLAKFVIVSGGSLLIGLFFGALSSLLTLATKHVEDIEPILLFVLAYAAYIGAEIFGWSGVVSIIGCGLFQAEFALRNVSSWSRITVHNYVKTLSATSDGIIFIFIGMIVVQSKHYWNVAFILLTFAFCVLYRLLSVLGLTFFANHVFTGSYVSLPEQLLMVHGGLRGAIAYILISMLEDKEHSQQHKRVKNINFIGRMNASTGKGTGPWKYGALALATESNHTTENWSPRPAIQLLKTTTLCVILATIFLLGSTTKPLLKYLQIKREVDSHSSSIFSRLNDQMFDDTSEFIRRIVSDKSSQTSRLYRTGRWLNQRFLRRLFVRRSKCINGDCGEVEEEEVEEEEESDSDDEEPLLGKKKHGMERTAVATAQRPLTVHSLVATPYERILRNYLAKQLRQKAKSITLPKTKQSRGRSIDTAYKFNERESLYGRKGTTHKQNQRYENDARSGSATNHHSQANRINCSVLRHTPERVIVEDLKSPPSPEEVQRRLNSSQRWRWARTVGPTGRLGQRAVIPAPASAWTYLPNSRSSLSSGPQSEHKEMARRQSLAELQTPTLPTANGLHTLSQQLHKDDWKRYRDTVLPYNLSARSDT